MSNDEDSVRELAYQFELDLEELVAEWERVEIDTASIRLGINQYKDPVATAAFLVVQGTQGFESACEALGCEMTVEALVVKYESLFDEAVVETARARLASKGHDTPG